MLRRKTRIKNKVGSLTKLIKRGPFNIFLENAYYKKRGKPWQKAVNLWNRRPGGFSKLKDAPEGTSVFLHTHNPAGSSIGGPGRMDVLIAFQGFRTGKYEIFGVSPVIGLRGKEMGRVFLRPTAETKNIPYTDEYAQELNEKFEIIEGSLFDSAFHNMESGIDPPKEAGDFFKLREIAVAKFLIKELKLKMRAVPMKGYRFNEERWRFEKIRKK
ncbi:MAG: hypothetical protein ABH854_02880 [Candidatus Diapherotrites archaeon]|nr:hypothetical protein [Candidatus Micrarchaeota archaeon]